MSEDQEDDGRVRFFGTSHNNLPMTPTPTGQACMWCTEKIEAKDEGFTTMTMHNHGTGREPWHYACFLRSIVGGVAHQLGRCTCFRGTMDDDPAALTRRQSAELAVELYQKRQVGEIPRA